MTRCAAADSTQSIGWKATLVLPRVSRDYSTFPLIQGASGSDRRPQGPAALHAFQGKDGGLTRTDARMILTLAPTPAKAAKLTLAQLRAALKRSGRTRAFDTEIARLRDVFRSQYARQLPAV